MIVRAIHLILCHFLRWRMFGQTATFKMPVIDLSFPNTTILFLHLKTE
jgi:hypothetical protein